MKKAFSIIFALIITLTAALPAFAVTQSDKAESVKKFDIDYGITTYKIGNTYILPSEITDRLTFVELTQSGSPEVKDFEVSVSDESIITLKFSEQSDIYRVYAVSSYGKTGNAVITVVADGVAQDFNYKVCNDFVYFFINLWFKISDFFSNIF